MLYVTGGSRISKRGVSKKQESSVWKCRIMKAVDAGKFYFDRWIIIILKILGNYRPLLTKLWKAGQTGIVRMHS
jgi:hypothetical protein